MKTGCAETVPRVRFDDLRGDGGSFALTGLADELVAYDVDDVAGVVARAEEGARSGLWAAGFVAYEAAPAFDAGLEVVRADPCLPLAWFGLFADKEEVDAVWAPAAGRAPVWRLGWRPDRYEDEVARIKELLGAGETYQVNLTVRARGQVDDPVGVYGSMARAQAGAYNAYMDTGTHIVMCASPELFFLRDGDVLLTRPMKGTSRRGRWSGEDATSSEALSSSTKDRAEHVMIVDLLRNDLGRISHPGTVVVRSLADLERYPTVWQLTSAIAARVPQSVGLLDVFGALFPCGSVTGAPKQRTMQIIASLEEQARGAYCGAVGYVEPGARRCQFAVAIRTATVEKATGRAVYGSGGAITWDSTPASEWSEIVAKCSIVDDRVSVPDLLETLRFDPAVGPVNVARHLQRLSQSADYFGIPFDRSVAETAIWSACEGVAVARRVRVVLDCGGGVTVESGELPETASGPVRLRLASERVDSRDVTLFHKSADRSRYDALRAAHPDVDDVVMTNERGELTEATIANIAFRLDGVWCTPPVECGLLPGVERQRLIDEGLLTERVIPLRQLTAVESVALVNSLRGWRRAVIEGICPTGAAGPWRCG
jgi:para-aminobenzoate synthetase / 4-amino-4-deoxychorismate lyase